MRIENEILMSFRVKRRSASELFISDPIDTDIDGNSLTLSDIMSEECDMVEIIDSQEQYSKLHRYVKTKLSDREREIINMRYGLNNALPLTQREVASAMGISRSYVSRIEKKALEKMRACFEHVATDDKGKRIQDC